LELAACGLLLVAPACGLVLEAWCLKLVAWCLWLDAWISELLAPGSGSLHKILDA